MHILLIHQAFVTTGEAGGTRHAEIGRLLTDNGHDFTVITSPVSYLTGAGKGLQPDPVDLPARMKIRYAATAAGLHQGFLSRLLAFFTFMLSSLFHGLRVPRPDIVWGTSPNLFQALTAWLVARCRGTKFVLEIRDLWPDFAIGMGVLKNRWIIAASRWLEKFLCRHADEIVVNSPGFIPHIQELCSRTPILIANGSDVDLFKSDDGGKAFRARHHLNGCFVVMYTGAHGPANDLDTVLDAAEMMKEQADVRFVLVGSGKEKKRLLEQAAARHLENVLFIPPVPKNQMADVLAAADTGLAILKAIPLFTTTYPNKVFDLMAAGKPVLCQIDGVIRQVVEQFDCGVYIQPGDPAALVRAICHLKEDPERCARMGLNGKQAVSTNFSRQRAAVQFEKLFERVCDHGSGR